MSIFARSTCAPSGNSPARMRRNRSRFSSALRVRYGESHARLGQRAAMGADLVGRVRVDVGQPAADQVLGVLVEPLVVVRRVVLAVVPVEAEPADVLLDGVHVLDVLLDRVGVVEAQVAVAAVLGRHAEVEADGLGVADVQVAVGLGRKPGDDSAAVDAGRHVGGDDLADEVNGGRCRVGRARGAAIGTGHGAYQCNPVRLGALPV